MYDKEIERQALIELMIVVQIDSQLFELSQLTARLSVTLDVNDNDNLHLKYRSEK